MQARALLDVRPVSTINAHRKAVEHVILAMRQRLDEDLPLHRMAEIACLSPFHFNRVFHQMTGIPPTQFLWALRLEAAKHLLLTTDHSVTRICYDVGYNSLGTFIYRFTQLVGLSPGRFRKMAQTLEGTPIDFLLQTAARLLSAPSEVSVTGRINCAGNWDGPIFVGLFESRLPQGRPVSGTLLMSCGTYRITPMPDGRYNVLAVAMPRSANAVTYWLPDSMSVLVAASHNPVLIQKGKAAGRIDLTLRPAAITDPPILVALPSLLAQEVERLRK